MPDHDKSRRPKKQFGSHIFPDQEKMWFFIWEWYEKVSNLIRGIRRGDAIGVSDRENFSGSRIEIFAIWNRDLSRSHRVVPFTSFIVINCHQSLSEFRGASCFAFY